MVTEQGRVGSAAARQAGRDLGGQDGEAVPAGLGGSRNQRYTPRRPLTVQAEI